MLQLCYNFMMQKIKRLFCVGMNAVLGMLARCFEYAHKVFWAGSQGCLMPSRSLRKGVSYLVRCLVNPCEVLSEGRGGTI